MGKEVILEPICYRLTAMVYLGIYRKMPRSLIVVYGWTVVRSWIILCHKVDYGKICLTKKTPDIRRHRYEIIAGGSKEARTPDLVHVKDAL